MNIKTVENCPACNGKGEVEATFYLLMKLRISYIMRLRWMKKKLPCVHILLLQLTFEKMTSIRVMAFKYKKWIKVRHFTFHLMQYALFDKNEDELSL